MILWEPFLLKPPHYPKNLKSRCNSMKSCMPSSSEIEENSRKIDTNPPKIPDRQSNSEQNAVTYMLETLHD